MLRLFLLVLLLIQSLGAVASAEDLVLDLNQQVNTNLLTYSDYYYDTSGQANADTIRKLSTTKWTPFGRDQFRLGFTNTPIWIRTRIKTNGQHGHEVALTLHKIMDHIELEVSSDGEPTQYFALGRGTQPSQHHLREQTNLNHAALYIEPNKTYDILLKIHSANPVIGEYRIIEQQLLAVEDKKQNQWVVTFLLLIFLVSFYNVVIYAATHNRAFLFHICYVVSLLTYLLNDYGYIVYWFQLYHIGAIQTITAISIISAYLSIVAFFNSMNHQESKSLLILRLNQILFSGGYLLMVLAFVLPYDYFIRILSAQILVAICVGIFISFYRDHKFKKRNHAHKLTLRITLITFAPAVVIHLLNRLGFLDSRWYTDFILFFSTFVEAALISGILFLNINRSKEAFRREVFSHSLSGLPNERALRSHFDKLDGIGHQTLVQVWISGLDRLEIAFGPVLYKQFIADIAIQMQKQLLHNTRLIPLTDNSLGSFPLFHSDKNTFTLLCYPLDIDSRNSLQSQLNHSMDAIRHLNHNSIDLRLVIGAHEFDRSKANFDTVSRNSLLALSYGIKRNKKFKYYNPQIGFDEQMRITLLNDFYHSLNNNEFFLLWQPQYDTKHPKISGVEVLTRWQHPHYGLISPDVFIPLLEQSTRICKLSHWVISQVFEQLPTLHNKHPQLEVSVNLSPRDLLEDGLIPFLDKQCALHTDLLPCLTLEITETMMINDYSKVLDTIDQLQSRGFNISIDDFGSGYASFAYLQKLPANELKIDKSYTDCYKEHTTYAILESIIELAKRLNMRIVVEGIEQPQQVELFTNLGAERLQGWILDKPMSLQSLLGKA